MLCETDLGFWLVKGAACGWIFCGGESAFG